MKNTSFYRTSFKVLGSVFLLTFYLYLNIKLSSLKLKYLHKCYTNVQTMTKYKTAYQKKVYK